VELPELLKLARTVGRKRFQDVSLSLWAAFKSMRFVFRERLFFKASSSASSRSMVKLWACRGSTKSRKTSTDAKRTIFIRIPYDSITIEPLENIINLSDGVKGFTAESTQNPQNRP
jgi:hypothetical protein